MNKIAYYRKQIPSKLKYSPMSQVEMAAELGYSGQSVLGNYEVGRIPNLPECRRIVKFFNDSGLLTPAGEPITVDDVWPPEAEQKAS